jgi:trehalose 6-phosphate phosphatase
MAMRPKGIQPFPFVPMSSQKWALFLDVDGTLLNFAATPAAVEVPEALITLLAGLQIGLNGAIAFISGRSIEMLDHLFHPLSLPCAGQHGAERRDSQGNMHRITIDESALERLRDATRALARAFPGVLLEDKFYSIALHYREVPAQQSALRAVVDLIAQSTGFEVQPGHHVFEFKPPAINKGDSLTAFLTEPPFLGRLPVFLGDDLTDVHALEVAQSCGGMAIQVGDLRTDTAQFTLSGPAAVLRWLRRWEETLA